IVVLTMSIMLIMQWRLAILMLLLIPVMVVFFFISRQLHRRWQRKVMETGAELESQLVECIQTSSTIRHSGIEKIVLENIAGSLFRFMKILYTVSVRSLFIGSGIYFTTRFFSIILL